MMLDIVVILGAVLMNNEINGATDIPCNRSRSNDCVQSLNTFIRLDRLPFVETDVELVEFCRKSQEGISCTTDFLRDSTCLETTEIQALHLQVNRSRAVFQLVCKRYGDAINPTFRRDYLQYSPCILKNEKKVSSCHHASGMPGDPEGSIMVNSSKSVSNKYKESCCPVERYIECAEQAIGPTCGNLASTTLQTLLKSAAGQRLAEYCAILDGKYPEISTECYSCSVCLSGTLLMMFLSVVLLFL